MKKLILVIMLTLLAACGPSAAAIKAAKEKRQAAQAVHDKKVAIFVSKIKKEGLKNLKGADLEGANLKKFNLEGADLSGAHLLAADLEGANLKGANLKNADLRGANLDYADARGVDIRNATIFQNPVTIRVYRAKFDIGTCRQLLNFNFKLRRSYGIEISGINNIKCY